MRKVLQLVFINKDSLRTMSQKLVYPAADRNKQPILDVLKQYLPTDEQANVLEISSGSGQHISYLAEHFPNLTFQPSEYDTSLLTSIQAYAKDCPTKNIRKPIQIDVTTDYKTWNLNNLDFKYILNVNMIHISPFQCTEGLFMNCSQLLKTNSLLITYGPYANNGVIEPESNVKFDRSLRQNNPEWGLRDIQELKVLAKHFNFELQQIHNMPANNKILIWKKLNDN